MKVVIATALIATALLPGIGMAQDSPAPATKPQKRGGAALQLELTAGGDDLDNDEIQVSGTNLGQGGTLSFGGFYRPWEASRFELQGLLGYKIGWAVPIRGGGGDADVSRWVVQLLGIHHTEDRLYVGGGLVYHANPKYAETFPDAVNIGFDNAVGATVVAGWSWIGLQCTYMEYRAAQYGKFDASNCGVRFTFRFRKWRSLEPR